MGPKRSRWPAVNSLVLAFYDLKRPHHFVVLVFKNMAMPNVGRAVGRAVTDRT